LVDSQGLAIESGKKPSSEFKMHLRVYQLRPNVDAVVHAHPTFSTLFASSDQELGKCLLTEAIVTQGRIPKAKVALPSTDEVPDSITNLVHQTNAILLANHGLLTYGANLEEAYNRLESVEHFAKIQYFADLAGIGKSIDQSTVSRLESLRSVYGLTNPIVSCSSTECNKSSENEKKLVDLITRALSEEMR